MEIKRAVLQDLEAILQIYERARNFMALTGNKTQWSSGYPNRELAAYDMEIGRSYVCAKEGVTVGVFVFQTGEEPTYRVIYEGAWRNEEPYGTIHRLAASGAGRGVAAACFGWCQEQSQNLRADTHKDNRIMQHLLEKNGFLKCGRILLDDKTSRIAYQRTADGIRIPS